MKFVDLIPHLRKGRRARRNHSLPGFSIGLVNARQFNEQLADSNGKHYKLCFSDIVDNDWELVNPKKTLGHLAYEQTASYEPGLAWEDVENKVVWEELAKSVVDEHEKRAYEVGCK